LKLGKRSSVIFFVLSPTVDATSYSLKKSLTECFTRSPFQRFLKSALRPLISLDFSAIFQFLFPFSEHNRPCQIHWMTSEQSLPLRSAAFQRQLNAALRNIERCALDATALQEEFVHPTPNAPQLKSSNEINFDFEMKSDILRDAFPLPCADAMNHPVNGDIPFLERCITDVRTIASLTIVSIAVCLAIWSLTR